MKYLVILLLLQSYVAQSQSGILFHDACDANPKFGSGSPYPNDFWNWRHGDPSKSILSVSDSFSRAGKTSYRLEIKRDSASHLSDRSRENYLVYNFVPAGTNSNFATNMGQPEATNKSPINLRWISLSTLLPEWYPMEENAREPIAFFLNNIPENYGPAQYLEINNGRYIFHLTEWINTSHSEKVIDLGPIVRGVWVDWVLERNYTNSATGFVRFYKNGELVINLNGGNWPPDNLGYAKEPYTIHGMLELSWATPLSNSNGRPYNKTIYYDEFKFGDSTAQLSDFQINSSQPAFIFYDNVEILGMPFPTYPAPVEPTAKWSWFQGDTTVAKLHQSAEYARTGTYSYRFDLSNGIGSSYLNVKSELVWNFLPAGSPLGTIGSDEAYYRKPLGLRWIAYSTLIPAGNADRNTVTSIGLNTKSVADDWPTPAYLSMENDRYQIRITKVIKKTDGTYTFEQSTQDVGPVIRDQWEDWIMERNWTSHPTEGFIRLYKNKSLVFEYVGGNWVDDGNHSKEPYMQMGLYKWAFSDDWNNIVPDVNKVTMFIDEIKFGNDQMKLEDFYVNESNDIPPVVNAGEDIIMYLPSTRTKLTGNVVDKDGTIFSKAWRKISGPPGGDISDSLNEQPIITNLQAGNYVYQLIAKDNANKVTSDEMMISIMPPISQMVLFDSFTGGASQTTPFIWKGGTTSNSVSVASRQPVSGDFALQMTVGMASAGAYLAIDKDANLEHIYTPEQIWVAVAMGKIYIGDYLTGASYTLLNTTVTSGDFIRILRVSDTYKVQYSKNNGSNWTDAYTYQYKSSATIFIKVTYDYSGAYIYYPTIYTETQIPGLLPSGQATLEGNAARQDEDHNLKPTQIVPNPVQHWINILPGEELSTGRLDIRIYDIYGKLFKKQDITFIGNRQSIRLPADILPNGNYIVSIRDNKGKQVQKKIIIQH